MNNMGIIKLLFLQVNDTFSIKKNQHSLIWDSFQIKYNVYKTVFCLDKGLKITPRRMEDYAPFIYKSIPSPKIQSPLNICTFVTQLRLQISISLALHIKMY